MEAICGYLILNAYIKIRSRILSCVPNINAVHHSQLDKNLDYSGFSEKKIPGSDWLERVRWGV